jgi:hypothetical protein
MADEQVSIEDRIGPELLPKVADSIIDEYKRRKDNRKDTVKIWNEVDRQVAMKPDKSHKLNASGSADSTRAWFPEIELPLQAQTLEMLTADSRRLKFPSNRNWFRCRAALTEDYLTRFEKAASPFAGERGRGSRSVINQDNADRLAEAMVAHWHAQYDFRGHIGVIDAEAFRYSCGVGRVRGVKRKMLGHKVMPTGNREQIIPVYVPRSIKTVYPDDSQSALMHEGIQLGPNVIQTKVMKLVDVKAAAKEGGSDASDQDGGWIWNQVKLLKADKNGNVELVELEGDLVIEESMSTTIHRDVVVTAAIGAKSGSTATHGLVRYREGPGYSSYVFHHYHMESASDVLGTSPLIKGMPVAKLAAQAMNLLVESGQLKVTPPVGYDKDDPAFAASGGPVIEPMALWESLDGIQVFSDVGGDPQVLFEIFAGMVQLYADVTGVNAPRLGAETKSHTTAFAKGVEREQGAVRTVDYVASDLEGPMTRLLNLEYKIGFQHMRNRETVYIEPWEEFVTIGRRHLPDIVRFAAIGSAAPADNAQRNQDRLQSAQLALQLDASAQQMGHEPTLDLPTLIRQVLSMGGWQDVEALTPDLDAASAAAGEAMPAQVGAITEQGVAQAI